jgi:hypothetical protein
VRKHFADRVIPVLLFMLAGLLLAADSARKVSAQQGASTATVGGTILASWSTANTAATGVAPGANTIKVSAVLVPYPVTFTKIAFHLTTGDAGNNTDVGVYGPCAQGTASCPLVSHIGAQAISSTAYAEYTVASATLVPSTQPYWFAATSAAGTAVVAQSSATVLTECGSAANSPTTSSGGALPATISVNVTCNNPVWGWNTPFGITFEK